MSNPSAIDRDAPFAKEPWKIEDVTERALAFVRQFQGDKRATLNCKHAEALAAEVYTLRASLASAGGRIQELEEALTIAARVMEAFDVGVDPEISAALIKARPARPKEQPSPPSGLVEYPEASDYCQSGLDGECNWHACPQLRDGEPLKSGRHCPLDIRNGQE